MSTRGFVIEILLHIYNVQQTEVISGFLFTFITIMRAFSRSFYCSLIHIQTFFNDYDVTTLKIIHPITFRNSTKHPIKVLQNKNNIM